MAQYNLKSYDANIPHIWEYERLDEFGILAVEDLDAFTTTSELYKRSLENIKRFAEKASDVEASLEISENQSLGISSDEFLTGVPHTFDGIIDMKLIARATVPEPTEVVTAPYDINVFPTSYKQVNDALIISQDIIENTTYSVVETDGTSTTKAITGPTLTYRVEFKNPTEINFVSFFAAVPLQLLNVTYRSAGTVTSVVADTQAFGQENIYFAPATVSSVDLVFNQPIRLFNTLSEYVFVVSDIDSALNLYPETWTWTSKDMSFIEDIHSVEVYSNERNTTATPLPDKPKTIGYIVNADKPYHIARRDNKIIELSTDPASDRQLVRCHLISDKLFLPLKSDVINVYENGLKLPIDVRFPEHNVLFTGSGLDDMTFVTGSASTSEGIKVEIDGTGSPDTFQWSKDGGDTYTATGVNVSTTAQDLGDTGVSVVWAASTGHTSGDDWYRGGNDCKSGVLYEGTTPPNYMVEITSLGSADVYKWSNDGGVTDTETGVTIQAGESPLDNGMTIIFGDVAEHVVGDQWYFRHNVSNDHISNSFIDFRGGFEYFADVAFTNNENSYTIYPQGHRASISADFSSYLGDRKTPPIIDELWVRIRLKRDTHLF